MVAGGAILARALAMGRRTAAVEAVTAADARTRSEVR